MLEFKNIQERKEVLGQFFTPEELALKLIENLDITTDLIIEPSFGSGNFLTALSSKFSIEKIIGIELDEFYYDLVKNNEKFNNMKLLNENFYDFSICDFSKSITFVGNPPFRTPAWSLKTHNKYVKMLCKKYDIHGIREEAIFFIVKTCDILIENDIPGYIYYIVPSTIIKNNTKFYKSFMKFLIKYFFISISTIEKNQFDNVSQDLIFLQLEKKQDLKKIQEYIMVDTEKIDLKEYIFGKDDLIPHQEIFKRSYLGSVPCESIFISISGEPIEHFRQRLIKLFYCNIKNNEELLSLLSFDGKRYLKVLGSGSEANVDSKLDIITNYINEIKRRIDLNIFSDSNNYKPIRHRKEDRYYFRHRDLKGLSFVYELNPNPGQSFYFTGNPSHSSTDYFGYCSYDVTRNSSPGACRTIPLEDLEENLVEEFKVYWNENTNGLDYKYIFDYIIFISKTQWYRDIKKEKRRMYFSLPKKFNRLFLEST